MNETKSILASKGVWGGVIAVLAGAAGFFGYALAPSDATALAEHAESAYNAGVAIVGAVGGLIAIWGRVSASKKIG